MAFELCWTVELINLTLMTDFVNLRNSCIHLAKTLRYFSITMFSHCLGIFFRNSLSVRSCELRLNSMSNVFLLSSKKLLNCKTSRDRPWWIVSSHKSCRQQRSLIFYGEGGQNYWTWKLCEAKVYPKVRHQAHKWEIVVVYKGWFLTGPPLKMTNIYVIVNL